MAASFNGCEKLIERRLNEVIVFRKAIARLARHLSELGETFFFKEWELHIGACVLRILAGGVGVEPTTSTLTVWRYYH